MCADTTKAPMLGLCIVALLSGVLANVHTGSHLLPGLVFAQGDIIVEGADYNTTITIVYSADLVNVAQNVTPRVVMEYADYASNLGLSGSIDLIQLAAGVDPRLVLEYADFNVELALQGSDALKQAAMLVSPRIIVEYADFTSAAGMICPWPFIISVIQDPSNNVLPYQDVTISARVVDFDHGIDNATLYYTVDGGAQWFSTPMNYNSTSNLHWSILPGQQEGTRVNYKITAYDSVGNLVVSDNSGFTYEYVVVPEFPQLLILPLFMVITLAAVILSRKKWHSQTHIERRIAL